MHKSIVKLLLAAAALSLLAACATPPALPATATIVPNTPTVAAPTTTPVPEPSATPAPDPALAMDTLLSKLAEQSFFSGSVLVAGNDKVLLSKGYGLADREQNIANTPQTKFVLASVSKQFTAMSILILEHQGKLDVQKSVCQYIPDCPAQWQPVTLHHLLAHTAGVPDDFGAAVVLTSTITHTPLETTVGLFRDLPLLFAPGTSWSYSTAGYALLTYVVEQVSGQSYGSFLRQYIFDPLKMANSGFLDNKDPLAIGYNNSYQKTDPPVDLSIVSGGGGLYSTVEDLFRWDQALYTEKLIPQAALDRMFTVQAPLADYGYGWVISTAGDHKLIYHTGGMPGVSTENDLYPDDHVAVIVLSNQGDASAQMVAGLLAHEALKAAGGSQ